MLLKQPDRLNWSSKMTKYLLKKHILCGLLTVSLTACVDEGYDPQRDGSPLNLANQPAYDYGTINDVKSPDAQDRYYQIDLLEGISNYGGIDKSHVLIKDVELDAINPDSGESIEFNDKQVILNGQTLTIDKYGFDELIDGIGKVTELNIQYWVDNGFQFECDNMRGHPARCTEEEIAENPNLRQIKIAIKSTEDRPEDYELNGTQGAHPNVGHEAVIGRQSSINISFSGDDFAPIETSEFQWSSSDENIFTVDENGEITGVALGEATLTATHPDYDEKTLTVTVYDPLASFSVEPIEVDMEQEQEIELIASPQTAAPLRFENFSFEIIDDSGQVVDTAIVEEGQVKGLNQGMVVLKTTSHQYPELESVETQIEVINPVEAISLEGPLYIERGQSKLPTFNLEPENILTKITTADFNWSIKNGTGSATVLINDNEPSLIKGDGTGKATLSATYNGLTADDIEIIITDPLTEIALQPSDELYLAPENTTGNLQLAITPTPSVVVPEAIAYDAFEWTVTPGTGNATIDENGLITGTQLGSITVTAKSKFYDNVTDSIELNVQNPPVVDNLAKIEVKDSNGDLLTEQAGQYQASLAKCHFIDITPVAIKAQADQDFGAPINFNARIDSDNASIHRIASNDGNNTAYRISLSENAAVGDEILVTFDLLNYQAEADQFTTLTVTENLMCTGSGNNENNGAIFLVDDGSGELELANNWTVFNKNLNVSVEPIPSTDNGPGLGYSLQLNTGTDDNPNRNQFYSPFQPAGNGLTEIFKSPTQTWKLSYWIRVIDSNPAPIDLSLNIEMRTRLNNAGNQVPQSYLEFDETLNPADGWVKYEYEITGLTLAEINEIADIEITDIDDLNTIDARLDLYIAAANRQLELDNIVIEPIDN